MFHIKVSMQGGLSPFAPVLIFGITALLGGVLALILPETNNKILPNTIEVTTILFVSIFLLFIVQEGEEFCSQIQILTCKKKERSS